MLRRGALAATAPPHKLPARRGLPGRLYMSVIFVPGTPWPASSVTFTPRGRLGCLAPPIWRPGTFQPGPNCPASDIDTPNGAFKVGPKADDRRPQVQHPGNGGLGGALGPLHSGN